MLKIRVDHIQQYKLSWHSEVNSSVIKNLKLTIIPPFDLWMLNTSVLLPYPTAAEIFIGVVKYEF